MPAHRVEFADRHGSPEIGCTWQLDNTTCSPSRWDVEYQELVLNVVDSNDSSFNATAAVTGHQLLFRRNQYLYCVGTK
ncbi:MAG: hypothetical protein ABGZ23_02020 [Fuerstiella sp.]|nr:hypothetical protein [Fuerstiella sp.]